MFFMFFIVKYLSFIVALRTTRHTVLARIAGGKHCYPGGNVVEFQATS